jgi:hypothetical protein
MAELEPLISQLRATPGANGCTLPPDGPVSRKACGEVLTLQAEGARAARRAELTATIAEADKALSDLAGKSSGAPGAADPLASALSAYATAIGRPVKADSITPWLALIPVLFLEIGSALGLFVVRACFAVPAGNPAAPVPAVAEPIAARPPAEAPARVSADEPDTAPAKAPDIPRKPRRGRGDEDGDGPRGGSRRLGEMVETMRAAGGRLEGGQRGIAKLLGVSKSRANELLHELAAVGAIRLATGRTGTTVELATT